MRVVAGVCQTEGVNFNKKLTIKQIKEHCKRIALFVWTITNQGRQKCRFRSYISAFARICLVLFFVAKTLSKQ